MIVGCDRECTQSHIISICVIIMKVRVNKEEQRTLEEVPVESYRSDAQNRY